MVSELTLMARIKPGFVEGVVEPITHATRLRSLLSTLFTLRKLAEEQGQGSSEYVGPLERLRVLHFVRYAIFDDDRRLLLAVSFDHSWETYMRVLVDNAGPLLDAIFCHCTDYAGSSCSRGEQAFSAWVREHQIPVDFFFAAEPGLTVDDMRYLKEYVRLRVDESLPEQTARLHVGDYGLAEHAERDAARALSLLTALHRLARLFPRVEEPPHSDEAFYEGTVRALLWSSRGVLDQVAGHVAQDGALREVIDWYRALYAPAPPAPSLAAPELDRSQIQGNILREYPGMTHACLVLMQCDDGAAMARLLNRLARHITYDAAPDSADPKLNLALTAHGLRTLGLGDAARSAFPAEFVQGMEARAGLLGDIREHHPERWQLPTSNWPLQGDGLPSPEREGAPIPLSSVDVVVLLQTQDAGTPGDHLLIDAHPLREDVYGLRDVPGTRILRVETMRRYPPPAPHPSSAVVEPFGFRDGDSQPHLRGAGAAPADEVAPGELVMGYPDERGEVQRHAMSSLGEQRDLFENGSFLVVRKLAQDVPAFRAFAQHSAAVLGMSEDAAAARIMGRDKLGNPLLPSAAGLNEFDYQNDPDGVVSPLHAHMRRANPRKPNVEASGVRNSNPRIARRSLPYGPDAEQGRGLLFMAYNASIAQQYEVIQSWLSGANPTGLRSACNDLLTGVASPHRGPHRIWANGAARELPELAKSPVALQWGMYLFVPGRAAIERFAAAGQAQAQARAREGTRSPIERSGAQQDADALERRGHELLAALARLPRDEARFEWKRILEGPELTQRLAARAAWAAIRARGGALATPYGVLVGDATETERVLSDHTTFSVREYYARMRTVGPLHLGMDPQPCPIARSRPEDRERDAEYEREVVAGSYAAASGYNASMYAIGTAKAFELARAVTTGVLNALLQEYAALAQGLVAAQVTVGIGNEMRVDLRKLAFAVMQQLAQRWFDLPPGLASHFWAISLDAFRPNPEPWVRRQAEHGSAVIAEAYRAQLGGDARAARDRIAAVLGFTGPTTGTFMSVMSYWHGREQLGRLKQWWDDRSAHGFSEADPTRGRLHEWLIEAMQATPVPDLLHRTALRDCTVGSTRVAAGDRVIVSIASASAQCPARRDLLFGGDYGNDRGLTHACPGQPLAIGVLLGMIAALLDRPAPRFVGTLMLGFRLR